MLKEDGYILLDDGSKLPYMGQANRQSKEEWNAEAARQAIKNYAEDHGKEPESIEQAFQYLERKYGTQPAASQDIPARNGEAKIVYYQ